jgi:RNA recognition motif-containing protein
MNTKVYVANLAAATTENELMDLFSPYGNVAQVNVPKDRTSGRPRGFGCVTMATPEGARLAIQALDGKAIENCTLVVGAAPPPAEPAAQLRAGRSPLRSSSHLY